MIGRRVVFLDFKYSPESFKRRLAKPELSQVQIQFKASVAVFLRFKVIPSRLVIWKQKRIDTAVSTMIQ